MMLLMKTISRSVHQMRQLHSIRGLIDLPHTVIRAETVDVYLTRAQGPFAIVKSEMKCWRFCVIKIGKVDRTNTDPKLLHCKVIVKEEERVR